METSKSELNSSAVQCGVPFNASNKRRPLSVIRNLGAHGASIIAFVGTLLNGLWGINSVSFSNDEHCTWWAFHLGWRDFLTLTKNIDAVLLPYYLTVRGWTALFGDSESSVRLPSVIAMAIAAGMTVKIGQRIADPMTGLFAGLFLSAIPATVFYAQTARPNAIAVATAVGVVYLFFRASDAPTSRIRWFAYGVSIVLTGLLHFVSLGVLAAQLPIVFSIKRRFPGLVHNRTLFRNWATTVFLSIAILCPFFYICSKQAGQLREAEVTLRTLAFFVKNLTLNGNVGGLLIAALVIVWIRKRPYRVVLTLWVLLPTIFFFLTYDVLHIFRVRYFAFTLPAWALISALATSSNVERSKWKYLLPCMFLIAMVVGSYSTEIYSRRTSNKNSLDAPYKRIASILSRNAVPSDAIIYSSNAPRQYHDRLGIAYAMRHDEMPDDILVEKSAEMVGDYRAHECRKIEKCVQTVPDRLWLLTRRAKANRWGDIARSKYEFISSRFSENKTWKVRQFNLILFTKKRDTSRRGSNDFVYTSEAEKVTDELDEQFEE
jgi:mannosyltransferase